MRHVNKNRRDLLMSAKQPLARVAAIIGQAIGQESDCLDNIPENLQGTERYEKMEQAIDNLEEAMEHIDGIIECIDNAIA